MFVRIVNRVFVKNISSKLWDYLIYIVVIVLKSICLIMFEMWFLRFLSEIFLTYFISTEDSIMYSISIRCIFLKYSSVFWFQGQSYFPLCKIQWITNVLIFFYDSNIQNLVKNTSFFLWALCWCDTIPY